MNTSPFLAFDETHLARCAEQLSAAALHALPYGAIRLDWDGRIVFYSDAEARLSGYARPTLGKHFFTEVAPCLANAGFHARIEQAQAAGLLDIEFSHIGDFNDACKEVCFRIQSASDGGVWIFTQRLAL